MSCNCHLFDTGWQRCHYRATVQTDTSRQRSRFGIKVHSILEDNKRVGRKPDSIRSLAREMANGGGGKSFEVNKRDLFKWSAVSGEVKSAVKPSQESREAVAAALGCSPDEFADDEEPHPMVTALDSVIRAIARSEFAELQKALT